MSGIVNRQVARPSLHFPLRLFGENELSFDSLHQLEQIFDFLPIGLACLDSELRFIKINKTLAGWMGRQPAELIGQSLLAMTLPWPPEVVSTLQRVLQTRESLSPVSCPHLGVTEAGQERVGKANFFRLQGISSATTQALLIMEDVTPLQSAAQESQRLQDELQHQRLELEHVRRVSTVGDLAASLAHELNQPLTAILSNAQAALRFFSSSSDCQDEVQEILKDIVADDKRAGAVIRSVRGLLRKPELENSPIVINQLVSDVEKILHSSALLKRAVICLELSPGLPVVQGDPVQLQQVLLNLAINGLDAMHKAEPIERILRIRTSRRDADHLQVTVVDAGHGLEGDSLNRIFEPFYTTKKEGLGMGLSIAKSIVEAHKGLLWAEVNPMRGMSFHFTLPVTLRSPR